MVRTRPAAAAGRREESEPCCSSTCARGHGSGSTKIGLRISGSPRCSKLGVAGAVIVMLGSEKGKTWWEVGFAVILALLPIRSALACSCCDRGGTPAERANYVLCSDWVPYVFVGRVLNVTSYEIDDDDYIPEFQNVTWSVEEPLFNGHEDGSLPQNVQVGEDGTMTADTSTETTCCLCGMSVWGGEGARYLISLSGWGGLSMCDVNCIIDPKHGTFCADTVAALRSAGRSADCADFNCVAENAMA
ncbi:hypothetical protein ACHAWF_010741 [Thalassiosira exigua]